MTYWLLNAVFLAIAAALVIAAIVSRRTPRWSRLAIAASVVLILTAVFDNVLILIGIVDYDSAHTSGIRLGVAPIEDFAYAIAAIVALPCLWTLLTPRRERTP
jgi:lycopene cyclase domain-containing protein